MPTTDENPEVFDHDEEDDKKACPHCGSRIDYMNVSANYTEWGRCRGTFNKGSDYTEWDDHDCSESEENDEEFSCPDCSETLDYDFFDQEDEEDGNEEVKRPRPIVNAETNSETEALINITCPECQLEFQDIVNDRVDSCVRCGHVFIINEE